MKWRITTVNRDAPAYNRLMEEMEESRQVRRAKLAETIQRKRHSLYVLKITEGKVPSSMKERHGTSIQRITEEIQKLEEDFHKLNVQQIREELKGG